MCWGDLTFVFSLKQPNVVIKVYTTYKNTKLFYIANDETLKLIFSSLYVRTTMFLKSMFACILLSSF